MAWNTPGGNKGGQGPEDDAGRSGRGGGNGGGWGGLPGPLKDLFDGGIVRWVVAAVVLLVLFSSFQLIGEQQRGVVLRFGQFSRILQPGPNFKLPWPIESVTKVNATEIKTFSIQVPVLTRDENIVNVSLNVQYRIDDPQYLFGTVDANQVLEQSAQSAVREEVGRADLNAVLNNRGPLAVAAEERLQALLKAFKTGLTVTGLTLQDARPPEEVKPAFDEVNGAQQVKASDQRSPGVRRQGRAGGPWPGLARPYHRRRLSRPWFPRPRVTQRFSLLQAQYKDAPEVTRKRLWLETVQQVLSENRKVIGGDGRQLIYVPMTGDTRPSTSAPAAVANPDVVMPSLPGAAVEASVIRAGRWAARPGDRAAVRRAADEESNLDRRDRGGGAGPARLGVRGPRGPDRHGAEPGQGGAFGHQAGPALQGAGGGNG